MSKPNLNHMLNLYECSCKSTRVGGLDYLKEDSDE
jgi:hypothetical protein